MNAMRFGSETEFTQQEIIWWPGQFKEVDVICVISCIS